MAFLRVAGLKTSITPKVAIIYETEVDIDAPLTSNKGIKKRFMQIFKIHPKNVRIADTHSKFICCNQMLLAQPVETANAAGPLRIKAC